MNTEFSLKEAIKAVEKLADHTRCPDPAEGGCIGGPIPGYGCVHEAASYALRRLQEVERGDPADKKLHRTAAQVTQVADGAVRLRVGAPGHQHRILFAVPEGRAVAEAFLKARDAGIDVAVWIEIP